MSPRRNTSALGAASKAREASPCNAFRTSSSSSTSSPFFTLLTLHTAHCTSMVGCTGVGFVIVHLHGVVCVCTPSYAAGVVHACRLVCTVNKVKKGEEVEEEEEDVLKALHGDASRTFDSQVPCAHCVWFHLVYLSCTPVLHTPHGYPHVQPTPSYGCYRVMRILCDDGTMPTWTCNGVCSHRVLWLRSSTRRCTSSSSSTPSHIHDTLPIHTTAHMVPPCAYLLFLPLEYVDSEVCVHWEGSSACRQGDAACPFECEVPRTVGSARQLDACHVRVLGDVV